MINVPVGTKDILPSERPAWDYLCNIIHETFKAYGFGEIRTPVFEATELFSRGVGDTTDVVEKQMYTFEDKGGRSLTLRPEGTAGVVRSYIENGMASLPQPVKIFYDMPIYRYEKKQKGRYREFTQCGVELFGSSSATADVEVIAMVNTIFARLGISDIQLVINSIGCSHCRPAYNAMLKDYFKSNEEKICETCKGRLDRNPLRILDCKNPDCHSLADNCPKITDHLCPECAEHFEQVKAGLDALGIKYVVDPFVVRGFDYYSKTVCEFISTGIGSQGAVCAGGRYDGLVEILGGPHTPAVGFAMGIERMLLHMESCGLLDKICAPKPKLYIAAMGQQAVLEAERIAYALRTKGIYVETDIMSRSFKAQFKYADKIGAEYTLALGDNEIATGKANLKRMADGQVEEINLSTIVDKF